MRRRIGEGAGKKRENMILITRKSGIQPLPRGSAVGGADQAAERYDGAPTVVMTGQSRVLSSVGHADRVAATAFKRGRAHSARTSIIKTRGVNGLCACCKMASTVEALMEGCTAKLAFKKALRMWMQQRRGSADLVPLHEVCRFLAAHSDRYVEHGGQDRAVTFGVDPDFPKNETVLLWTDNTPAAVGYGRAVDALWDARAVQRKRPRRPTVDRDLVRESGKVFLVTARPEDDAIDGIELHSCHDATAGQLVGASTFDGVQQAISPLIAHGGTSLIALRVAVDEKHHLTCVYVFRKCLRHANAHAYYIASPPSVTVAPRRSSRSYFLAYEAERYPPRATILLGQACSTVDVRVTVTQIVEFIHLPDDPLTPLMNSHEFFRK